MGRTSHLESASELDGGVVLDGDGVIGDSIGIITQFCLITAGISPAAPRFTTGTISIVAERTVAERSTIPMRPPDPSAETIAPPADTLNHAVKAASARVPSVGASVEERLGVFHRAEAPASEEVLAAAAFTAVVGGGGNLREKFLLAC